MEGEGGKDNDYRIKGRLSEGLFMINEGDREGVKLAIDQGALISADVFISLTSIQSFTYQPVYIYIYIYIVCSTTFYPYFES